MVKKLADKLTTWLLTGVVMTPNPKATGKETFISLHANTIVKNGKPTDGKVINLTRDHVASANFSLTVDPKTNVATLVRNEGSRGRKARVGATVSAIDALIASVRTPATIETPAS